MLDLQENGLYPQVIKQLPPNSDSSYTVTQVYIAKPLIDVPLQAFAILTKGSHISWCKVLSDWIQQPDFWESHLVLLLPLV